MGSKYLANFKFGLRRALFRAKIAAIYHLAPKQPKKPVFILCHERTGSNLLINCLNSHPSASFADEVLCSAQVYGLGKYFTSKKAVFRHLRHTLNAQKTVVCGVKILFSHLERLKIPLEELISAFPDTKWIVLYRRDILSQYLSHCLALKTGQWIRYSDTRSTPIFEKIRLDPTVVLAYRDKIKANYEKAYDLFKGSKNCLWLNYEDLASNTDRVFHKKIFYFLGLQKKPISTQLVKQNDRAVKERIVDYEKVKSFVENTDFFTTYE